jgi:basic amino acid/polyamine antiporter, APA family
LLVVTALYIGLQVVAQGVLGAGLADAKAPLVAAASAVLGPWGGRLLLAATILSTAGFLAGDMLCSPRVLYALAEEKQLPRKLAFVHPRFGTPAVAVAAYACLCATLALSGSFRQLVVIAASGTLLLYLICCLGVLKLRASNVQTDGTPFNVPGGPIIPLAASAIIIWMLTTLALQELLILLGFVVVAGLVYAVHGRIGRASLPRAARAEQAQNIE